jgi:hypothetical protein
MTTISQPGPATAYTRASVEAYLRAAAAERTRIGVAIDEARRRTSIALLEEQRLVSEADRQTDGLEVVPAPDTDSLFDQLQLIPDGIEDRWPSDNIPAAMAHE